MLANLSSLLKAFGNPKPPRIIWQKPFDYDPSHYERLCNLNGSAPSGLDLCNYAHDMIYEQSPLQPDLFRYLLPICLEAWRKELFADNRLEYGAFVEYFWQAFASTDVLKHLSPREYAAVETFMAQAILDRMDAENSLSFTGMKASPYRWFHALGSYCVVFAGLPALWESWRDMATTGRACAWLQYLSCLLYEASENPIFSPWTPVGGGGAPCLWEMEGFIYDKGWRAENVAFLQETLTPDFVEDRLHCAAKMLEDSPLGATAWKMLEDFAIQKTLLEMRLEELPALLIAPYSAYSQWTI